jgi:hypothetical protein
VIEYKIQPEDDAADVSMWQWVRVDVQRDNLAYVGDYDRVKKENALWASK